MHDQFPPFFVDVIRQCSLRKPGITNAAGEEPLAKIRRTPNHLVKIFGPANYFKKDYKEFFLDYQVISRSFRNAPGSFTTSPTIFAPFTIFCTRATLLFGTT